jgi:hypothetical protein
MSPTPQPPESPYISSKDFRTVPSTFWSMIRVEDSEPSIELVRLSVTFNARGPVVVDLASSPARIERVSLIISAP